MKALSIRQPWAELIISGRKTMELRSWRVSYRGPLAIHASQTVEREACRAHGLDPDAVTTGAVVGAVDLSGIEPLDAETYTTERVAHLDDAAFKEPLFGWRLQNPQRWPTPLRTPGKMALFEIQPPTAATGARVVPPPARPEPPALSQRGIKSNGESADRPFELRVLPGEGTYSLALHQEWLPGRQAGLAYRPTEAESAERVRVVEIGGPALRAVTGQVLEALRHAGYKITDLSASRREPFRLPEEAGLRLGLLFLAVKPISKLGRVEAIADGLRAMASEEAYYWYSKCTAALTTDRALKALRILLSEE